MGKDSEKSILKLLLIFIIMILSLIIINALSVDNKETSNIDNVKIVNDYSYKVDEINDELNKLTTIQIQELENSLKNEEIIVTGEVVDIFNIDGISHIIIKDTEKEIMCKMAEGKAKDREKLLGIDKSQEIKIKGKIENLTSIERDNLLPIQIVECNIIK